MSVIFVSSQYQMMYKRNTAVWTTDNFNSVCKQISSLMKMTKRHAHVVHMAKHITMVGGALLVGGTGLLVSPLNPTLDGFMAFLPRSLIGCHLLQVSTSPWTT